MAKSERPPTFDELLSEVSNIPDPFKAPNGGDISNPFSVALPAGDRVVDTTHDILRNPDARDAIYAHHSEVYNLSNREEREAYDEQQTLIANTKGLIPRYDDKHWTKEGDAMVLLQWVEVKNNPAKAQARRLREKNEDDDDN